MKPFITVAPGVPVPLTPQGRVADGVHVFDKPSIDAINAAYAAGRPLLVKGEPGIGKSQLARAAAEQRKAIFVPFVVDSHTEARDLLWHFDAVERLADAQLFAATVSGSLNPMESEAFVTRVHQRLNVENYLRPGPLWWAFAWKEADQQHAESRPPQSDGADITNGCVVLIDEIDKAESDVPNGLLEALGAGQFKPHGRPTPVKAPSTPPLVVITSNDERALPDAFLRRCLVLHLTLPKEGLADYLIARGEAHFGKVDRDVLKKAAEMLCEDRETALVNHWRPLPGQAEYLDLLRAVLDLESEPNKQIKVLEEIRTYVLKKHEGAT